MITLLILIFRVLQPSEITQAYIQWLVDYLVFGKLIFLESFRESNSLLSIIQYKLLMRDNYYFKQCFVLGCLFVFLLLLLVLSFACVCMFSMCLSKYQYLFFFHSEVDICPLMYIKVLNSTNLYKREQCSHRSNFHMTLPPQSKSKFHCVSMLT